MKAGYLHLKPHKLNFSMRAEEFRNPNGYYGGPVFAVDSECLRGTRIRFSVLGLCQGRLQRDELGL